jgi:AcrR family transcriptional regulator
MAEPRTERGRATREKILITAARLFHERGVSATSVEQLLAAAQAGKSQFYRYFPSKDNLVSEVIRYQSDHQLGWQKTLLERLEDWRGSRPTLAPWSPPTTGRGETHPSETISLGRSVPGVPQADRLRHIGVGVAK